MYAAEHDIIFNTKKSVTLIRRSKMLKDADIKPFVLCGENLKELNKVKYLGYYITSDGKDDKL